MPRLGNQSDCPWKISLKDFLGRPLFLTYGKLLFRCSPAWQRKWSCPVAGAGWRGWGWAAGGGGRRLKGRVTMGGMGPRSLQERWYRTLRGAGHASATAAPTLLGLGWGPQLVFCFEPEPGGVEMKFFLFRVFKSSSPCCSKWIKMYGYSMYG